MIAYILESADKASMLTSLASVGMTYVDDVEGEKWVAPPQCRFFELTGITQHQLTVADIITTPRLVKSGFWLLLYANAPIASVEALDELKYCCDTQMGEFTTHCQSVTTTPVSGDPIIDFDGFPSGVSFDCF